MPVTAVSGRRDAAKRGRIQNSLEQAGVVPTTRVSSSPCSPKRRAVLSKSGFDPFVPTPLLGVGWSFCGEARLWLAKYGS